MTRQEPQARGRKCKRRPWQSAGSRMPRPHAPPAASQSTSAKKASQSSSQGRSAASKPASSRRPASQPVSSQSGAKVRNCTKIFRKPRKITSLGTSPRRNPSVPRAGAHRNGLRDVKEARTSPLLPPESRRLEAPFSEFFAETFGTFRWLAGRRDDAGLLAAERP